MAAPKFTPVPSADHARSYESPDHVPDGWMPDRPGEISGRQPAGTRLGYQGPDQGYALRLASRLRDRIHLAPGESIDDAIQGVIGIAMRRASLVGRAPVMHDVTVALTIWGFLDENPPKELVEARRNLFAGVGNVQHHYAEARALVDMVPELTLRKPLKQIQVEYPARWRDLTGV